MGRPRAAPTIEHKIIGEYVEYGDKVGIDGKFDVQGTVVYADGGSCTMTFDNGTKVGGVLNIIKLTFSTGGMKYAVTVDGERLETFRTLAAAATWAGV